MTIQQVCFCLNRKYTCLATDGMENMDHGSRLDGMENNEIFKTMKRQWNILITGSSLDGIENSGIFKTMKNNERF